MGKREEENVKDQIVMIAKSIKETTKSSGRVEIVLTAKSIKEKTHFNHNDHNQPILRTLD